MFILKAILMIFVGAAVIATFDIIDRWEEIMEWHEVKTKLEQLCKKEK